MLELHAIARRIESHVDLFLNTGRLFHRLDQLQRFAVPFMLHGHVVRPISARFDFRRESFYRQSEVFTLSDFNAETQRPQRPAEKEFNNLCETLRPLRLCVEKAYGVLNPINRNTKSMMKSNTIVTSSISM